MHDCSGKVWSGMARFGQVWPGMARYGQQEVLQQEQKFVASRTSSVSQTITQQGLGAALIGSIETDAEQHVGWSDSQNVRQSVRQTLTVRQKVRQKKGISNKGMSVCSVVAIANTSYSQKVGCVLYSHTVRR